MANVVITSDSVKVNADFGVYATSAGMKKGAWRKSTIISVMFDHDEDCTEVRLDGNQIFKVSYSAHDNSMIVDSVDGIAPSDNTDLYAKLLAFIV